MADKYLSVQCIQMFDKYLSEAKNLSNDSPNTLTPADPDMAE